MESKFANQLASLRFELEQAEFDLKQLLESKANIDKNSRIARQNKLESEISALLVEIRDLEAMSMQKDIHISAGHSKVFDSNNRSKSVNEKDKLHQPELCAGYNSRITRGRQFSKKK